MRRTTLCLLLVALAALAGAGGTATAAPGQAFHFRISGSFAEGMWETTTTDSVTDTLVLAQQDQHGPTTLFLDMATVNFDGDGNVTGSTELFGTALSGVSFAIDNGLAAASTNAAVPATFCTFDADGFAISCVDAGSVDVAAGWTGEGEITRNIVNRNEFSDGFHFVEHFNGTDKEATATSTVDGTSLSLGDLVSADLGTSKTGELIVCHSC